MYEQIYNKVAPIYPEIKNVNIADEYRKGVAANEDTAKTNAYISGVQQQNANMQANTQLNQEKWAKEQEDDQFKTVIKYGQDNIFAPMIANPNTKQADMDAATSQFLIDNPIVAKKLGTKLRILLTPNGPKLNKLRNIADAEDVKKYGLKLGQEFYYSQDEKGGVTIDEDNLTKEQLAKIKIDQQNANTASTRASTASSKVVSKDESNSEFERIAAHWNKLDIPYLDANGQIKNAYAPSANVADSYDAYVKLIDNDIEKIYASDKLGPANKNRLVGILNKKKNETHIQQEQLGARNFKYDDKAKAIAKKLGR